MLQRYNIDFRRSMERRIEMERIREHILVEEIVRWRILEEEVRRELMLEKEMALRALQPSTTIVGSYSRIPSFLRHEHSRIPYEFGQFEETRMRSILGSSSSTEIGFHGSEQSPFQHLPYRSLVSCGIVPCLEPSEETLLLAKPETNISGQKRKSQIREPDHDEVNNINTNKKPRDWNCMLCHVRTTSKRDLNKHVQGRKHRAKQAGLVAQETDHGITALEKKCSPRTEKPISVLVRMSDPGVNKTCKADGESSENVHTEAEEAIKQDRRQKIYIDSNPRSTDENARKIDLHQSRDCNKLELQRTIANAKSLEKLKLWCEMCQVGVTCAQDMSAHEKGKKHLAKLHKAASSESCSTKLLSAEKDAQGIEYGDVLPKKINKEIMKNGEVRRIIPFEMEKTFDDNEQMQGEKDIAKDKSLVAQKTCFGASPVAKSCKLSTSDPGVKMGFKDHGKSSGIVAGEAAFAEKQNNILNLNDKTDPTTNGKPKDADSNGNGDTSGPQTTPMSAKSGEKLKFWCEMCQVGLESAESMASHEGGTNHIKKLHEATSSSSTKPLPMEKDAQGIKEGAVLPKETKLKNMVKEAGLAVQRTVNPSPLESMGISSNPSNKKARFVNSNKVGDAPGLQTIPLRAKSCEKLKLRCEMSQFGTCSSEGLSDHELYEASSTFLDVAWPIKEVSQDIIDEDMLPKGAKETEKDRVRPDGQESVLLPLKTQGTVYYCTDGASESAGDRESGYV